MKKWTSVLAVFVAVMMIAAGAFAQAGGGAGGAAGASGSGGPSSTGVSGPGTSGAAPGATTGDAAKGLDKSKSESPSASPATGAGSSMSSSTASADFTGRHTMEGEVVKVDQKKGHLTLKTAEGNMDLHFPASALQTVKKGDRISVELAMKPAGQASMKSDGKDKGSASPKTESKTDKK